jgi:hypothetical protein
MGGIVKPEEVCGAALFGLLGSLRFPIPTVRLLP